jgi:ABC-type Fe3+-siderophore transport system permease subunit
LKWCDGRGENGITSKRIFLKLKSFSPPTILTCPLFEETLGAFLFLPLFSFFFSMIFLSLLFFMLRIDVSYVAPQAYGIVSVALHLEFSPGIVFIFSQGRKDLYHV